MFGGHIENLCRPANFKLHGLRRIRKYLSTEKAWVLCIVFINSQFNYAPIIWMFCNKTDCHKIEKIQHRALKVIYDCEKSYKQFLLIKN